MSPKTDPSGYSTLVREPGCSHLDSSTLTYDILLSSGSTLRSLKAESTHLVPRPVSFTSIHHATLTRPLSHCSPTSSGPGLRPPITACQAASPNGVRCQSAQWLKLKPRETPAPLLFCLFVCPSLLAADTELWVEMDVQDYVNRK